MTEIINQDLLFIIIGAIIAIIGIIIQQTKSYSPIAGYNTMSEEKRKTVNIAQVAIALRNALVILGLIWIVIPVGSDLLELGNLKFWLLICLHLAVLTILITIINRGKKYKIKNKY